MKKFSPKLFLYLLVALSNWPNMTFANDLFVERAHVPSLIKKLNSIPEVSGGVQMGWEWNAGALRCFTPSGLEDSKEKPYCTISALPKYFASEKIICKFAIKPDGTDPLKEIYTLVADMSSLETVEAKKIPVTYKGSRGNDSLFGSLEINPYTKQDEGDKLLQIDFRFLPSKNLNLQSNSVRLQLSPVRGSRVSTSLTFPNGEIVANCESH